MVSSHRRLELCISIHTPLAGSDSSSMFLLDSSLRFQSTLPLRGATRAWQVEDRRPIYFNPHSPCGERLADQLSVML